MKATIRGRRWGTLGALLLLLGAACNDNDLGLEKRRPNRPPETILASGPPDSTDGTNYKVLLFWSGSDPDGTIDHYDFILVDHPAADDCIDCDSTRTDRVVVRIPEPDDPRWTSTTANDTIIVTKADTLRRLPPADPTENEFVRRQSFERWHTFFVRAVDNEGFLDRTPEYRSFNSQTIAPEVFIKPPVDPSQSEFQGPKVIVFNWDGVDDVGDGTSQEPIASRWVLLQSRRDAEAHYAGYPDSLYNLAPGRWQPWRRWDAADKSGRRAIVRNLIPADDFGHGFYLFAVQAMDEAGAVTPVFDAHTLRKNNVAKIFVNDMVGAALVVDERFLGTYTFVGLTQPVILDVAAGQAVTFKWRGDASSYGGEIVAYRYGWNIRNPGNDEEWEQNWCETCRSAPTRVFSSGSQRFFVETRDNAETITHAEIELTVRQVTRSRNLLLVDDAIHFDDPSEFAEDARWNTVVQTLQGRRYFEFDPSTDIYDVKDNRNEPPPLPRVFDYKTVVWAVRNTQSTAALGVLATFFDPFIERNRNAVVKFNFLSVYVDNGGEFWMSGDQPGHVIWPLSLESDINLQLPKNLTNWDDPITPHPDQDSVGVRAFLWKMGVEAIDLGGGGRAQPPRRDNLVHNCTGLRRARPGGWESQTFASSQDVDHQHDLVVATADVDAQPAAGVTDTTTLAVSHVHTVHLSQPDLQALAAGNTVTVVTSESSEPEPHAHTYTLCDAVGLWGGPQVLERDDVWWPSPAADVNPYRGRVNVEIYNMPSFLAQQTPPLQPDPRIWTPLYYYTSPTPEDPDAGDLYPLTADGQPSVILRRARVDDRYYSRALCAFEVWRLKQSSHIALADFILLRHFRVGLPDGL